MADEEPRRDSPTGVVDETGFEAMEEEGETAPALDPSATPDETAGVTNEGEDTYLAPGPEDGGPGDDGAAGGNEGGEETLQAGGPQTIGDEGTAEEGAPPPPDPETPPPHKDDDKDTSNSSIVELRGSGLQGKGKPGAGKGTKKDEKNQRLFDSKGSLLESGSYIKNKLEEFKEKRSGLGAMIKELQDKVQEYKDKKNPTDEDVSKLKKYHKEFLERLGEYEEMTRNIERFMGMKDVPSSQLDLTMSGPTVRRPEKPQEAAKKPQRPSQVEIFPEDKLPQVIVCGTDMGDNVPKIIVCKPVGKADLEPFHNNTRPEGTAKDGGMMGKLNECFEAQQKLAAENAELARMRQQMQKELLDKQDMLDDMRQRMMAIESERYRAVNENAELQKRLMTTQKPGDPPMCKREFYMKFRGNSPDCGPKSPGSLTSPLDVQSPLTMEQELEKMGCAVEDIYCELESIQKEKCALGYPTSPKKPVCKLMLPQKWTQTDEDKEKDIFFGSDKEPHYKELREQYQRLHLDFKNKVTEVALLRCTLEKTKTELDEITIIHHELESMHQKELDENNALKEEQQQCKTYKEQIVDLEQQANNAKEICKSCREEMDEMRILIEEQACQLDEYRNKYLKTLQIAEELKRENEFKERECADQIAVEIQQVKIEMQEQLEELRPIKDLLKVTQNKLKETEQAHCVGLATIADLSKKLEEANCELDIMNAKFEAAANNTDIEENLQKSLEEAEKRLTALECENQQHKCTISRLEQEVCVKSSEREEKVHEVLQLISQLETLREESARQVARCKERSEMVRKCLLAQISEMERELACCRAAASFANRERDEVRTKLQMEICMLSENFRESQVRIVQLHQHVNYLSNSHPTALIDLIK